MLFGNKFDYKQVAGTVSIGENFTSGDYNSSSAKIKLNYLSSRSNETNPRTHQQSSVLK